MFVTYRTKKHMRIVLFICLVYAVLTAAAAAIFPREGKNFASSYAWWLLAIPVILVVYAALEGLGTWFLGLSFWNRIPSWARILLLVLVMSFISVGVILVRDSIGSHDAL
jgi:membrane protease YdiL (CAAX protease family)